MSTHLLRGLTNSDRQTADTFLAAATFLELCQIWGALDPDVLSKVKFAKYHAVRIAKALKNGEDPNLSNPAAEPAAENTEGEALDPNDPEVQAIQGTSTQPPARERQASVEEVPDESDRIQRQLAQQSILNESLHPSRSSSIPPPPLPQVPLDSAASNTEEAPPPELPSAPSDLQLPQVPPTLPDTPKTTGGSAAFQSFPPSSASSSALDVPDLPQPPATFSAPSNPVIQTQPPPVIPTATPTIGNRAPAAPVPGPAATSTPPVDDNSISQAQKHARWAVSALSFDDVNTAIRELKIALQHLGAE
jgi:vacuolar protein sorting-associated protein VTA1